LIIGEEKNKKGGSEVKKALGTHILLELFDCDPSTLRNSHTVKEIMIEAATKSNAKIVDVFFHQFEPYGVSGVVVIEESHFTIHTWPEFRFAAVDLFFCSEDVIAENAIRVIVDSFRCDRFSVVELKRGVTHSLKVHTEKGLRERITHG